MTHRWLIFFGLNGHFVVLIRERRCNAATNLRRRSRRIPSSTSESDTEQGEQKSRAFASETGWTGI